MRDLAAIWFVGALVVVGVSLVDQLGFLRGFEERQQQGKRRVQVVAGRGRARQGALAAGGELLAGRFVFLQGQADLLEIVLARRQPRGLAGRLDGRQQQGHENADDRDHDQQLDQRKANAETTNSRRNGAGHGGFLHVNGGRDFSNTAQTTNALASAINGWAASGGQRRVGNARTYRAGILGRDLSAHESSKSPADCKQSAARVVGQFERELFFIEREFRILGFDDSRCRVDPPEAPWRR